MKLLRDYLNSFKRLLKRYRTCNKIDLKKRPITKENASYNCPIIEENFDYSKNVLYPSKQVIDLTRYLSCDIENNPETENKKNDVLYENDSLYMPYINFLLTRCYDGQIVPTVAETVKTLGEIATERKIKTVKSKLLENKAIYKPTPTSKKYKVNYSKLKELYIHK